jgi:hypothetical protein
MHTAERAVHQSSDAPCSKRMIESTSPPPPEEILGRNIGCGRTLRCASLQRGPSDHTALIALFEIFHRRYSRERERDQSQLCDRHLWGFGRRSE